MTDASPRGGVFASLRGLLVTGIAIARTRLELLATEVEEEKARILGLLVFGGAAVILLAAGLVFFAIFLTVLCWDSNRLLVLAAGTTLFLGGGIVSALVARRYANRRSTLFSASLAELARDQQAADNQEAP
jgi:uncharacterized membrane protein YqjE